MPKITSCGGVVFSRPYFILNGNSIKHICMRIRIPSISRQGGKAHNATHCLDFLWSPRRDESDECFNDFPHLHLQKIKK